MGKKINYNEQITYSYSRSIADLEGENFITRVFGYVNDINIDMVNLVVEDNNAKTKVLEYKIDKNRMFIFYWDNKLTNYRIKYLIGKDQEGNKLYEENLEDINDIGINK